MQTQVGEARSVPVNRAARGWINPKHKAWVRRHHERRRAGRASGSNDPDLTGGP
ncbi:fumarylacetoacetate hydrolase [Xanthomonas theicola]|uniref:Fumarylacetoacetate hydrolase n=1 Tax=Xanthomonas theicola TaxID=56464 RepID=A0A2S6ZLU8_9XANT|nr:fumarylacetoacetate hydrolase [Xanthomonas theicola]